MLFPLLAWIFWFERAAPHSIFHLALTRLLAAQRSFHLDVVSQAADAGWAVYFPGRDYLFHALGSVLYRFGGERALLLLAPTAFACAGAALYWLALIALPPVAACAYAIAAIFAAPWALPMLTFGPGAFSLFCFLLSIGAILRRRLFFAPMAAALSALAGPSIYPALVGVVITGVFAARERTQRSAELLAGTIFLVLCATLVNPYFPTNAEFNLEALIFPFTIALLPFAAARVRLPAGLLVSAAMVQLAFLGWMEWRSPEPPEIALIRAAVSAIPAGAAKVFNCETSTAAYLLYSRPDLTFVDALDPLELEEVWPARAQFRRDLRAGAITDPRAGLMGVFGSAFALCLDRGVNEQFAQDPSFQRLAPNLYAISPSPLAAFPRSFDLKREVGEKWSAIDSSEIGSSLSFRDIRKPGVNCARVRVPPREMKKYVGAQFLGLGGGAGIQAWRNGAPIYASPREFERSGSVQVAVSLKPPLKARDSIEAMFCSASARTYWSASISFWGSEICVRQPWLCSKQ
jgi:hypothetical protein